ncbi:MAG: UDP-N-acetylglucosamine 2-epimerase (non-hydrolyzing) [Desulfobacteraceae bacterium]|nr:UDP-N-acetylglucosamine 2-epimerase (non-hydrolyzing) [Desulfobacteraceae bacterium]MBC2720926.1 UDP-N-acetylglucosamine 2-epimerase (non-hydrolyzing) [Desulfobacteraceae bacterium]
MLNRTRILVLAGTRPEAIKLAPVILKLKNLRDIFEISVCATGQHLEMLNQAFLDFNIVPDINLEIMKQGQSLSGVTARLFDAINARLDIENPDWILVQGDTTSVMVGSVCGFYRKIKVGHIEAGLRSNNRWAPFPEEINRKIVSIVADKHFAPTEKAKQNLLKEGVDEADIFVTGNTVIDALLCMVEKVRKNRPDISPNILEPLLKNYRMVLITGHRRENFGEPFENICIAIRELAESTKDTIFVYPVHLNPNVREPVMRILSGVQQVFLTEPLSYKSFVWLMDKSSIILTDSGGIQEEALSLSKPVLVMREVTERPEGVATGLVKLVGTQKKQIVESVSSVLYAQTKIQTENVFPNPYGDGNAAARIVEAIR